MGSNVYLRICIFSKEITALGLAKGYTAAKMSQF